MLSTLSVVASRHNYGDPVVPRILDGVGERVELIALG